MLSEIYEPTFKRLYFKLLSTLRPNLHVTVSAQSVQKAVFTYHRAVNTAVINIVNYGLTLKWFSHTSIIKAIDHTCVYPTMVCQNGCHIKGLSGHSAAVAPKMAASTWGARSFSVALTFLPFFRKCFVSDIVFFGLEKSYNRLC